MNMKAMEKLCELISSASTLAANECSALRNSDTWLDLSVRPDLQSSNSIMSVLDR